MTAHHSVAPSRAGASTLQKNQFRVGDSVSGKGLPVEDKKLETAELYRVSKLKTLARTVAHSGTPPPWLDDPPSLDVYRARGHRRLDAKTDESKCRSCQWGCHMPVEMIIDQWNPENRQYRFETFCYGPLSCDWYKAGPTRKVPGRKGMSWEEEDWVDQEAVSRRQPTNDCRAAVEFWWSASLSSPGRESTPLRPSRGMSHSNSAPRHNHKSCQPRRPHHSPNTVDEAAMRRGCRV